jgi:hypothetical protein
MSELAAAENAWYETIEPGVRAFVRHLRNRGFNTTCSCEHKMLVQIACDAEALGLLWSVCVEFYGDENACEVQFYWHSWHRFAQVLIRMPDGSFNPKWSGRHDWAGNEYDPLWRTHGPALMEASMQVIRSCAARYGAREDASLSELLAGCDCDRRGECPHYVALAAVTEAKEGKAWA